MIIINSFKKINNCSENDYENSVISKSDSNSKFADSDRRRNIEMENKKDFDYFLRKEIVFKETKNYKIKKEENDEEERNHVGDNNKKRYSKLCDNELNKNASERNTNYINDKFSNGYENMKNKSSSIESKNFDSKTRINEDNNHDIILTTDTLEYFIKEYKFCTMENSLKKTFISIMIILILLINAYVNVDSFYNLMTKFDETQFILYNNTYLINSNQIENFYDLDFKEVNVITNIQIKSKNLKIINDTTIDFNKCSRLYKNELKIIDNLYIIIRGRWAFLLLSNLFDMIFLFLLLISLFPNKIFRNISRNSKIASLLMFSISNFNSIPVLGYKLFNLDNKNSCFIKYEYFEYFYYGFIIYGMYYAAFLFFNLIYFFLNGVYKLIFFIVFIIFPCFPFWSLCLNSIKKLLLEYLLKSEFFIKKDANCIERDFSSVILWIIIILGIIVCFLGILNFSILKYIHIISSERTRYISYASFLGLFLSFTMKIFVSFFINDKRDSLIN